MKILCLTVLLVLLSVFAYGGEQPGHVVGNLKTTTHILEIWSVDKQAMYVVRDKNGKVLTEKLSETALAKSYPHLSELMKRGLADDASLGPTLQQAPGVLIE
ncbi:hypothetical protein SAMN02745866_04242 [Alteromonadaceae bacterium Bs31]|nr:hypothetical protein SAMN02745866_04242 [Alteromonadaceae bacterium Bs31]